MGRVKSRKGSFNQTNNLYAFRTRGMVIFR